jgi:hypothetical protein
MMPAQRKNRTRIMAITLSVADKSRGGNFGAFAADFIFDD